VNNFSTEWDEIYINKEQLASWPWSDLVSLVFRHCKDLITHSGAVLELGCGAGPNIPFIQALGMDYYAIEGSATIVNSLHEKYKDLQDKVQVGDFTNVDSFTRIPDIDIIIDRAAVTHNNLTAIKQTLDNSFNALKSGGCFIGIDWFSTQHSDFKMGKQSGDQYTRTDIETGRFKNVGNVHFSSEEHIRFLFSDFDILHLSEKVINSYEPLTNRHQFATWNIVARKA
jgi:SAM-dependent methyltransferase